MAAVPTLLTADGRDPGQVSVAMAGDGLELLLRIGAGDELDAGATLRLVPAPGSGVAVAEETLAAVVASNAGVPDGVKDVAWVSADWGAERPLCCLTVALPGGKPAGKARVKVQSGGVWLPLMPADVIDTGSAQRFVPVMASKVMVELIAADEKFPGLWKPAPAPVAALEARAATLPGDLSLAVAGQLPFFRWTGLLPGAGLRADGLAAAVNPLLASGTDNTVRLTLKAGTAGQLRLPFQPAVLHVLRVASLTLPLGWAGTGQAVGQQVLSLGKAGAQIAELVFDLKAELPPVTLLGADGALPSGAARYASALDGVAQGFNLDEAPAPVLGVDLSLRRRSEALSGSVALHPDLNGRPAPQPYGGAVLPIEWPAGADPRGPDGWLSLDFPRPLQLPDAAWWVVLSLGEGEALWALGDAPPAPAGGCVYRQGEAQWLPVMPEGARWALARLRLLAQGVTPVFSLSARRGAQVVSLWPDDAGHVRADAEALRVLNRDGGAELVLRAEASCAGRLDLSRLRLACR